MKNILILLLLLGQKTIMAQDIDITKFLFDKKWKITNYEIAGQLFPPTSVGENDGTFFFRDSTTKSIDGGLVHTGKWTNNSETNTLTLYNYDTKDKTVMLIKKISDSDFIWETTNPEGMTLTIHMKPVQTTNGK